MVVEHAGADHFFRLAIAVGLYVLSDVVLRLPKQARKKAASRLPDRHTIRRRSQPWDYASLHCRGVV